MDPNTLQTPPEFQDSGLRNASLALRNGIWWELLTLREGLAGEFEIGLDGLTSQGLITRVKRAIRQSSRWPSWGDVESKIKYFKSEPKRMEKRSIDALRRVLDRKNDDDRLSVPVSKMRELLSHVDSLELKS